MIMIVTEEHLEKIAESHYPDHSRDSYLMKLMNKQFRKAFVAGAKYAFKVADANNS